MNAPTAAPPAAPPPAPPPEAETRQKWIDWRFPGPWIVSLFLAFCGGVGSWAIRTDTQVSRQAERIEAVEKRTMSAGEQAYELRNIASQLAEVNKKLADLTQIQSQMTVMEFRMGNAEFALGLTPQTQRKGQPK